jgi:hypothetical protein
MRQGDLEGTRRNLRAAIRARKACGYVHSVGHGLFEVLEWLQIQNVYEVEGVSLASEIESTSAWVNPCMQAVALRFKARMLSRKPEPVDIDAIRELLSKSIQLLSDGGALLELSCAQRDFATLVSENTAPTASFEAAVTAESNDTAGGDSRILARTILELGKLRTFRLGRDGALGELVARLCRELGLSRCAIIEVSPQTRVLAARGGDSDWLCCAVEMAERARSVSGTRIPQIRFEEDGCAFGLGLVALKRDCPGEQVFVCLEGPADTPLSVFSNETTLSALGVQLSVILGNLLVWEQISDAKIRLATENRYYSNLQEQRDFEYWGESDSDKSVRAQAERASQSQCSVLIYGETGLRADVIAREIHKNSDRRQSPFIEANFAAMGTELVARELFGYDRGAFIGAAEQYRGRIELAHTGTLYLEAVNRLSLEEQDRLLRVLQEGRFEREGGLLSLHANIRLVATSERELEAEVKLGRFRVGLLEKLQAFIIRLSPLRDRRADIPLLA